MRHWTLSEALLYGKGSERPFLCPVHGDSRPSASVNVVKKAWICYTCGAKGGLTGEDALIEPDYEVMKQWFEDKLSEGRTYPESWLSRYDAGAVHPYWVARVGEQMARQFRLGYDPETDTCTYPLRTWNGSVLGVVRRNLGVEGPKYLYPKGVDIGRLLFNYEPFYRSTVVLVEGALDAIALSRVGVHAFAIYGARLGEDQVRLVDRVDPERVVTAFDNDDAGYAAHRQVEEAFRHRLVSRLNWPRSWGKDVGEVREDRLRKITAGLVSSGLSCIESEPCRSAGSMRITRSKPTPSSRSTSTPRRLWITRSAG